MTSLAHYKHVALRVFWYGDTTTIRVLLALGSFGWTLGLWGPFDTFDRAGFAWMRAVANEWWWGGAFFLHGVGAVWRIIELKRRPNWAFAILAYGIALWIYQAAAITLAIGEYTPSLALEWCLIFAAFVSLVRTGLNEEAVSP